MFTTPKLILPFVETMATQVCNLSCHGCSNYSDIKHNGYVSWNNVKAQIEPWLEIVDIPDFGIIGGEPLINPEIKEWIIGLRELLPSSQIRFTTNGLLLHKHTDLMDLFRSIGNCVLKITVHQHDEWLEDYITTLLSDPVWQPVVEHNIKRWKNNNNVRLQVNRPDTFLKTYQGNYQTMRPYHNDHKRAFDNCMQKTCPLLHKGKIYKCSTAGLLKEILEKYNRPNYQEWMPYIDHGIDINSPFEDIKNFVENFGQPHGICSQCPTSSDRTIDHKITVFPANPKQ